MMDRTADRDEGAENRRKGSFAQRFWRRTGACRTYCTIEIALILNESITLSLGYVHPS
jgi:hypothetical protein